MVVWKGSMCKEIRAIYEGPDKGFLCKTLRVPTSNAPCDQDADGSGSERQTGLNGGEIELLLQED